MATLLPITIEQGADWPLNMRYSQGGVPIPMAGWQARMQVREVTSTSEPILTLSTETGEIILSDDGLIRILLPADRTTGDQITIPPDAEVVRVGKQRQTILLGFYDLELTMPEGQVIRLLEGRVLFSPEITR